MRIFTLLFLLVSISIASNEITYPLSTSPASSYTIKPYACELQITDNKNTSQFTIYGSPMGTIDVEFWVDDTTVIFSSGSGEVTHYFGYDVKNRKATFYSRPAPVDFPFSKALKNKLETNGAKEAFVYLKANTKAQNVDATYLLWKKEVLEDKKRLEKG